MRTQTLRFESYPVVPWKNGLGVTRVIFPAAADEHEPFGWRLSMADITTDAAFSAFSGIDRQLAVVDGAIELRIEDAATLLSAGGPAVAFSGDVAASAKPLDDAAIDLNLMVARESEFAGRIEPLTGGRYILESETVIVALAPQVRIRAGAQYSLGHLDSLYVAGSGALDIMGDPETIVAYGVFVDQRP
jgi:environmental stress-induced protein Ves